MAWLAASSARVGIVANAAVYAAAAVRCCAASVVLSALACISQARYGTFAATYDSALGPCQVPACTADSIVLSSSATAAYSVLNASHMAAAASSGPAPGPLLSNAEYTSGGEAIQTGSAIAALPRAPEPSKPAFSNL